MHLLGEPVLDLKPSAPSACTIKKYKQTLSYLKSTLLSLKFYNLCLDKLFNILFLMHHDVIIEFSKSNI